MTTEQPNFRKRYKLRIQSVALGLTLIAVVPLYVGLQAGLSGLIWAGLATVVVSMAIGLWGS